MGKCSTYYNVKLNEKVISLIEDIPDNSRNETLETPTRPSKKNTRSF